MATPETEVKLLLKQYLLAAGWFVRDQLQGRYSYKGMPDMFATRHGITVEIEAKSKVGKQSPAQIQYQEDLESHGGNYALVRTIEDFEAKVKSIERNLFYDH